MRLAIARRESRPALFYGWKVATALAITQMVSWGVLYYAFAVVQPALQRDLGWAPGLVSGAFSAAILASGAAAIPVGRLIDRFGGRVVMSAGSCAAAALVVAWARVESPVGLYAIWLLIGVAMSAVLYEPSFAVIAQWFVRGRAWALTILTAGGALSSVVFVPLAGWLVEQAGWRGALVALAAILALVTIPIHALALRSRPADLGLRPDGEMSPTQAGGTGSVSVLTREAIRRADYAWMTATFALSAFIFTGLIVHLIPYLTGRGYAPAFAAGALALLGGCQIPGRLAFAGLSTRVSWRAMVIGLFGIQLAAVVILFAAPGQVGVMIFAALFGAAAGAISPARAALLADFYGPAHYGAISGMQALIITAVRSAGPVGIALMVGAVGDYEPAAWLLIGLAGAAWGASILLARSRSGELGGL